MPTQAVLIAVVCLMLLVALAARIALNGQITLARRQAHEDERRWREGRLRGDAGDRAGPPPEG